MLIDIWYLQDGEEKTEKEGDEEEEDEEEEAEAEESSDDDYNQVSTLELYALGKMGVKMWFWQNCVMHVYSFTSTNMKWLDQ